MRYLIEDQEGQLHGEFITLTDLELYMDGVRNHRGENRHNSPILSTLDYIKSIGWYLTIKDDNLKPWV